MINLLNEKDFVQTAEGKFNLISQFDLILQNKLERGLKNQELIYTQDLRGIGKTYELIQFAKKYNLNIVVANTGLAHKLRQDYSYDNIYSQSTKLDGLKNKKCVVDECVNVELLKEMGIDILTGFTAIKNQSIKKYKTICEECRQEINEKDFYLINNKKFHICKKCIVNEYEYNIKNKFIELLFKMNIPFIKNLYDKCNSSSEYLRYINLPQYKNLKFHDSIFKINNSNHNENYNENNNMSTIDNNLIPVLDNEIQQLIIKVNKTREEENWGTYKNLINALILVVELKNNEKEKVGF